MATLNGGPGNDTLPGGFDHDTINGLGGNDSLSGLDGNDTLNGGAGNDKLAGGEENDLLLGDAGNDTLDGAGGFDDDTLRGGVGNDLYLVDSLSDVVEEGVGGGKDTIRATTSYLLDDGQEIESLILDSSGKIGGFGNALGNRITMVGAGQAIMQGWSGNDTLTGGVGDDALNGGEGGDIMAGGKGDDGYTVDSLGDKVSELARQGFDSVVSFLVNYTLGANLERLLVNGFSGTGNALNNTIEANELGNKLNGVAGDDLILGNDGDDTLDGGTGNDFLVGGAGADRMIGGKGDDFYDSVNDAGDVIVELAGGGIHDTVETSRDGYVLGANIEHLFLVGVAAISGTGNGLANLLSGGFIDNVLAGEAGNDTLDGGAGNDTLKGGIGNDLYLVDSFNDVVEEGVGGGKDTIRATISYQLSDGQEIESLILDSSMAIGGIGNGHGNLITMAGTGPASMSGDGGNDTLTGGVGNDELFGGNDKDVLSGGGGNDALTGQDGADTLKGGAGNDVLIGGLGADALFGEAGADVFVYSVLSTPDLSTLGNDKINGFQKGVDKINLADLIVDFGINADDAFAGKFVIVSKSGANTIVQFDQDGSAGGLGPVTLATVTGATLTAADVVLETS
jgi:Ca2+-binding RTX toxin-like protein